MKYIICALLTLLIITLLVVFNPNYDFISFMVGQLIVAIPVILEIYDI